MQTQDRLSSHPSQTSITGDQVKQAIAASQEYLLGLQQPKGYWWALLESNVTITAEVILLHKLWGTDRSRPMAKAETYLRRQQRDHGAWELYYGDGGDLSTTVEAYIALKLLGVAIDDPCMVKARTFILAHGGVTKTRIFTKMHLALIGCYDWRGLPSIPPWIMLLPHEVSPFTIYEMSSWARGSTVPLMIVFDQKPVWLVQPTITLDELYGEGVTRAKFELPAQGDWTDMFIWADQAFKVAEQLDLVPFRQEGLKAAEKWVLERQEATGDWGGIIPAMLNSMLALKALNYDVADPICDRGLAAIDRFAVETEEEYWVQPCISPVWDTALVMRALVDSGLPADHPKLQQAAQWLLDMQILDYGDWAVKNRRGEPGAWAFEFDNRFYPDVDDTAVVVMALEQVKTENESLKRQAINRAVKWIETMQCNPGGWAAFDLDNDQDWLNLVPYGDLKAMIDPNTADVTARVLEMEGNLGINGVHLSSQSIQRGLDYLMQEQEPEGCWFGRWGVNYIYGTSGVLSALATVGGDRYRSPMTRGTQWLVSCQNPDGGWGETCDSYKNRAKMGQGDSTASQTAWALLGLIAVGEATGKWHQEAIDRGIHYLLTQQQSNGAWDEIWYTGTGFPKHFYLRYHLYYQHFPLMALGRYQSRILTIA
ncbi:MAG: squalene--hopene cyclase [Synechococcales bacterium]|nr:squalene--hopene cyclase [Synechococcales bacterium]